MKITHNKVGQNLSLKDFNKTDSVGKTQDKKEISQKLLPSETLSPSKELNLSDEAQFLQKAKDVAAAIPDVDPKKVEKFRAMIDKGTYKVDSEALAEKILKDHAEWSDLV
jgi:negative regulator of flagellin synthesis FlgM